MSTSLPPPRAPHDLHHQRCLRLAKHHGRLELDDVAHGSLIAEQHPPLLGTLLHRLGQQRRGRLAAAVQAHTPPPRTAPPPSHHLSLMGSWPEAAAAALAGAWGQQQAPVAERTHQTQSAAAAAAAGHGCQPGSSSNLTWLSLPEGSSTP